MNDLRENHSGPETFLTGQGGPGAIQDSTFLRVASHLRCLSITLGSSKTPVTWLDLLFLPPFMARPSQHPRKRDGGVSGVFLT